MKLLLLCCALVLSVCAEAQIPKKILSKVVISCTCQDSVGILYHSALKDAIALSPRFALSTLLEEKTSAKSGGHFIHISVVSIDDSVSGSSDSVALSVAYLVGDAVFLGQQVQTCNKFNLTACATATLSGLDAYLAD